MRHADVAPAKSSNSAAGNLEMIKKYLLPVSVAFNVIFLAGWLGCIVLDHYKASQEKRILAAIEAGYREGLRNGHQAQMISTSPGAEHDLRVARARAALDASQQTTTVAVNTSVSVNATNQPPQPPGMKPNK